MKYHELPPNASRVINSLRDSGYDFNTAVADIVDNSIAAGANLVKVVAVNNKGEIRVAIADNGCGMSLDELCNALTYGSNEREDKHSLGKFGLGLKTASTSQCRRVVLLSRNRYGTKPNKLVLDIDHAEQTQRWEYIEDDPTPLEERYLRDAAGESSGTVVIWEKCDRLLGRNYKNPGGGAQQGAIKRKVESLRFHLAMVFERFLNPTDDRAANVKIFLNNTLVKPYDPFALRLNTETCFEGSYAPNNKVAGNEHGLVRVAAHVVPARDELKLHDDLDQVFPPRINPDSLQGLFVYRENRLIHWGDWCGLYKNEFHLRLCRVELSFDATLDDHFNVDFQKSKVTLSAETAEWLKSNALVKARSRATERYRKGVVDAETKKSSPVHSRANKTISDMEKADDERRFSVTTVGKNKRRINSGKGRSFIEQIPEPAKTPNDVNVRLVESLPDGALWNAGLFSDGGIHRVYVEINTSHPFYQRAYYACGSNSNAARCIDYIIWSLANAEYSTKDQRSLENYQDMVLEVSRTLRKLADDLPVDES